MRLNVPHRSDYASTAHKIRDVIADPTNIAVFSTTMGDEDENDECGYDNFYVYRANGTFMQFEFNYLD